MKLQIEELRTMVFGKKKPPRNIDQRDDDATPPKPPVARSPDSYQRPIP
jgi:hypothetical protein